MQIGDDKCAATQKHQATTVIRVNAYIVVCIGCSYEKKPLRGTKRHAIGTEFLRSTQVVVCRDAETRTATILLPMTSTLACICYLCHDVGKVGFHGRCCPGILWCLVLLVRDEPEVHRHRPRIGK